tara:strand:- start:240 stop:479 length:240 start_codon:yes stop_codon:yes gene_type:complete
MTVKQKDEIIDMLENLLYWDTCPQDYKDRIPELVKALSKVNNGVLDDVKECLHPFNKVVSGDEGDFCTECQKYLKTNKL